MEVAIILVVFGVNVALTILNGITSVRNNELLTEIRDAMNRNATSVPE